MSEFIEIDGYTIMRKLGSGGMAVVYLAKEDKLDRLVAIKVMNADLEVLGEDLVARFQREAQITAASGHPNIVAVYNYGFVDGRPYIAMDYLSGGTLRQKMASEQAMTPEEALQIGAQIASALELLHTRNIVHRDLKPDNVLFHQVGHAVLADFGIAKLFEANTQLTSAGMTLGTYGYLSPEQAMGEAVDGRSDIYSLGVVLFEALTRKLPIPAKSTASFLYALVHEGVEPLPAAYAPLQPVFDKALARQPDDRFQTVGAFREEIEDALRGLRRGTLELGILEAEPAPDERTVIAPSASLIPDAPPAPEPEVVDPLATGMIPGGTATIDPVAAVDDVPTATIQTVAPTQEIISDVRDSRVNTGTRRRPSLQPRHSTGQQSAAAPQSSARWLLPLVAVLVAAAVGAWLLRSGLSGSETGEEATEPAAAAVQDAQPAAESLSADVVAGADDTAKQVARDAAAATADASTALDAGTPIATDLGAAAATASPEPEAAPVVALSPKGRELVTGLQQLLAEPESAEQLRQAVAMVQDARRDGVTHTNLPPLEQQLVVKLNRHVRRAIENRSVQDLGGLIGQVQQSKTFQPLNQDTRQRMAELATYLESTAAMQFDKGFFNIPPEASLVQTLGDLAAIDPDSAVLREYQTRAQERLSGVAEQAYELGMLEQALVQLSAAMSFADSPEQQLRLQERAAAWQAELDASQPETRDASSPIPSDESGPETEPAPTAIPVDRAEVLTDPVVETRSEPLSEG